jgi:hypothetical protein
MNATPDPSEVRVTSSTGGSKGKKLARYDLIPAGPLHTLAELYGKGAEKYEDRNWERGYAWSLSFAALNRHLWLFWQGVDIDEETGLPHLAAVLFHAAALMQFTNTHPEFDDRPTHTALTEAVASTLDEDDREAFRVAVELPRPASWPAPYATMPPASAQAIKTARRGMSRGRV